VAAGGSEKDTVVERVKGIAQDYAAVIPEIKGRIQRAAIDKREPLYETYAFYSSVLKIAETYKDKYLA
jgi:hypothetical protein